MSTRRAFGRGCTEETAAGTQGNAEEGGRQAQEHSESDPMASTALSVPSPAFAS